MDFSDMGYPFAYYSVSQMLLCIQNWGNKLRLNSICTGICFPSFDVSFWAILEETILKLESSMRSQLTLNTLFCGGSDLRNIFLFLESPMCKTSATDRSSCSMSVNSLLL